VHELARVLRGGAKKVGVAEILQISDLGEMMRKVAEFCGGGVDGFGEGAYSSLLC